MYDMSVYVHPGVSTIAEVVVYYTIRILLSLSTVLYRTVYRDGDVPSVIRVWAKVSFHVLLSQDIKQKAV